MNSAIHSAVTVDDQLPHSGVTHTTLYDLIAAINSVVDAADDELVTACVVHLMTTQRLTYLGDSGRRRLLPMHRPSRSRRQGLTNRSRGLAICS
jgi:hypothetical protein